VTEETEEEYELLDEEREIHEDVQGERALM
jgi:hypothetical protein